VVIEVIDLKTSKKDFPKDFYWGVATSSYQVEGADLEDGKEPSIWTTFVKRNGTIEDGTDGMIACDHYHRWQEDIELLADLGVNAYRFSISWPRVFPKGTDEKNQKGIDFYNKLIDKLLKKGITPFVTMYHYELPQILQDKYNGWESRDIIQIFGDYAEQLFNEFGDRVKHWITLNQPLRISHRSYIDNNAAPGTKKSVQLSFQVAHHLLLAHAEAVKRIKKLDAEAKIGISNSTIFVEPVNEDPKNIAAARMMDQFYNEWFYKPLATGEYPEELHHFLQERNWAPVILPGDMEKILCGHDFWGVNYYSRSLAVFDTTKPFMFSEAEPVLECTPQKMEIYPEGLVRSLKKIHENYGMKDIYITENGSDDFDILNNGEVKDDVRAGYIARHIEGCLKALQEGVNLKGYFVWSLMDNFEWVKGYTIRYGLVYIDRNNNLKRIPKKSFYDYQRFLNS